MNKFIVKPPISIRDEEYSRLLGFPFDYEPDGKAAELANLARMWYEENGKPWIYLQNASELTLNTKGIFINRVILSSEKLKMCFEEASADKAIIAVVSAGKECEEYTAKLWLNEKPDEYFYLDTYGSAVVENLITIAAAEICRYAEEKNLTALHHYSPGYSGWNIEDQVNLFNMLDKDYINDKIEILNTGMLKPRKSMLALFGLSSLLLKEAHRGILKWGYRGVSNPCTECTLPDCSYRRVGPAAGYSK